MSLLKNLSLAALLMIGSSATARANECPELGRDQENTSTRSAACILGIELSSVIVTNTKDEAMAKGDDLRLSFRVQNHGDVIRKVQLKPRLTSLRFSDYSNIAIGTQSLSLAPGQSEELVFELPHYFADKETKKHYALGRGDYRFDLELQDESETLGTVELAKFAIEKSNVVNVLVLYDPKYFEIAEGRQGRDPIDWVREAQTRPASVYLSEASQALYYPGGFQELLGVKEVYQAFDNVRFREEGNPLAYFATAETAAKEALGLVRNWSSICSGTCLEHHGYDYMIALNPVFMGGVALSSGQISGGFEFDQSQGRTQMVITHESGHVYGAPHCDPLQGFIMCSGEKAESYKAWGDFLWLEDSVKAMNGKKFE